MLQQLRRIVHHDSPMRLWYHKIIAMLGAIRYGFPGKKLYCIGVTGTDGKTTTAQILTHIIHHGGYRVGMTTTQGFQIGANMFRNTTHKTTLGRWGLQAMLARMVKGGCTHAIIEVSSHALCQSRTWGIAFQRGIFTNLSREHLDYHKTMDAYRAAKGQLFAAVAESHGVSILNQDDDAASHMATYNEEVLWYGMGGGVTVTSGSVEYSAEGTVFELEISGERRQVHSTLIGEGNLYNMLAAATCAHSLGFEMEDIVVALESFRGVPGRMEVHPLPKGGYALIDYAVTPKALEMLYRTMKGCTPGKIIAVLGACGDRDQGKRSDMGGLAARFTDYVVITNEEPYTENPERIMRMIEAGVLQAGKEIAKDYTWIEDRKKAIRTALDMAGPEDGVLVTGMGDQDSMIIGTQMVPWSDREVIEQWIAEHTTE